MFQLSRFLLYEKDVKGPASVAMLWSLGPSRGEAHLAEAAGRFLLRVENLLTFG